MGQGWLRVRALVANTNWQSLMASSTESTMRAFFNTSVAPAAMDMAWSLGKSLGATNTKSVKPIVFMARAAEPIFPG